MGNDKDGADLFGNNVVYSYGDAQAVSDGVLHDIAAFGLKAPDGKIINRMTATITGAVLEVRGDLECFDMGRLGEFVKACRTLSDDFWVGQVDGEKLWLVPNEVGGYTLMDPSDY